MRQITAFARILDNISATWVILKSKIANKKKKHKSAKDMALINKAWKGHFCTVWRAHPRGVRPLPCLTASGHVDARVVRQTLGHSFHVHE